LVVIVSDPAADIRRRAFVLGCDVARLALALDSRPGVRCIVDQMVRAGTGIGANLEEAKAASSRREFVRFVEIALREAREALYWLRICGELRIIPADRGEKVQAEADQVVRILTAIVLNTKRASSTNA
jgi:four helix bundle protein